MKEEVEEGGERWRRVDGEGNRKGGEGIESEGGYNAWEMCSSQSYFRTLYIQIWIW